MSETPDQETCRKWRRRLAELERVRKSYESHWKELASVLLPRAGRFNGDTWDDGTKQNQDIYSGVPRRALRTLAAGLQGGMTSPARPWFKLVLEERELMEWTPVREWLYQVQLIMNGVFAKSNFYQFTHSAYLQLGAFGTACGLALEEPSPKFVRFRLLALGEYYLAVGAEDTVTAMYRKFRPTVAQLVEEFGYRAVSDSVRAQFSRGSYEARVKCVHAIQPRDFFVPNKIGQDSMPWASIYWEESARDTDPLMYGGGYPTSPILAPRWDVLNPGEVYGDSVGMDALPDVQTMMAMAKDYVLAMEQEVKPTVSADKSLKGKITLVPGQVNWVDMASGRPQIQRTFESRVDLGQLGARLDSLAREIQQDFYNDLFRMITEADRTMTAREVVERHEEKLVMLGPVLDRLHTELLAPAVERTYGILASRQALPPPPKELDGHDIQIEFVSILAQAQRMAGTTAIRELAGFVGNLAAVFPSVTDKFDADQAIDEYSDMVGTPPTLVRSDDAVQQMREQRAQAQQVQQAMERGLQMAQGAKVLSETPMEGDSALDRLLGNAGRVSQ